MGKPPHLKTKVRSMLHRKEALALVGQGLPITTIAEQMGMAVQSVRRLLRQALATDSLFPTSLDGQQVAQLRQIEGERLTKLWQKVQLALDQIQPRLGSDGERNLDGTAVARLVESGTRVSEQISRLYGLLAPTKVIEEQLRISYQKTEQKITISFDAGVLEPPQEPIPGLEIFEGNNGNGNTEHPQLPNPAAAAVATELPG